MESFERVLMRVPRVSGDKPNGRVVMGSRSLSSPRQRG
ncbi:hypothetical protein Ec53638_3179 [Escherichia coli 53638]|nr:hypothetical protein Ec53638_3179 [Escherichia coli 53638]